MVATAAFGVLAGLFALLWIRTPSPREERPVRKLALAVSEPVSQAVISPNGRHIAYVTSGLLKVLDLDQDEPRQIAGPGIAGYFTDRLLWSPDSEFIVFQKGNELLRVAARGGRATTICELPGQYMSGSWSPDGRSIFFGARHALYEVSSDGGEPQVLVEPMGGNLPYVAGPMILPSKSGRKLLYSAFSSGANDVQIVAHDLTTGRRDVVAEGFSPVHAPPGHIIYRRFDPPAILALPFSVETLTATGQPLSVGVGDPPFSVSNGGTLVYHERAPSLQQLVWRDRNGDLLGTIGQPRTDFSSPSLSPGGGRVAFSEWVSEGNPDIWVYDVDGPGEIRVTADEGRDMWPVWSTEGESLVFTSSRAGDRNLFVTPADGRGEAVALLVTPALREYATDWSRDGKTLLFHRVDEAHFATDLWYLNRTSDGGDFEEVPFLRTPANESASQLSPGGNLVAYVSDQSGRREVYLGSFPDGEIHERVSAGGGSQPRWRADGKELFYVQGEKLMAVAVSTSPSLKIGAPEELFASEGLEHGGTEFTYDVSDDGKRFVLAEQVNERSKTVHVVQNWFAELQR